MNNSDCRYYGYDEICLVPNRGVVDSRKRCTTAVTFGNMRFRSPIIPANMPCVIDDVIARYLSEHDYFYIMDRFGSNSIKNSTFKFDTFKFVQQANLDKWRLISISVGVKDSDKALISRIALSGLTVHFITIDIAHGDSVLASKMISHIRKEFRSHCDQTPFIIAGNVATPGACEMLRQAGADAIKVGISCGKACSTYSQTGFGMPMFTTVLNCACEAKLPIIADGGIRNDGDVAKALVAGATMVMVGSLFAACMDAPGETVIYKDPTQKPAKIYYGSASSRNKESNSYVEGKVMELPTNDMTYEERYEKFTESLQSSISYAGGTDLSAFLNVRWAIKAGS